MMPSAPSAQARLDSSASTSARFHAITPALSLTSKAASGMMLSWGNGRRTMAIEQPAGFGDRLTPVGAIRTVAVAQPPSTAATITVATFEKVIAGFR
jgi:hypothetical protein